MPRKTRKERQAELLAPPPPIEGTLAMLNALAVHPFATKARSRRAIKEAHLALAETLQTLESFSKYETLVSRGTVDAIHKAILRRVKIR